MSHVPNAWAPEVLEVITTGFPFCVFKLLVGHLMWTWGLPVPAVVLVSLGVLDAAFNTINLVSLLVRHRRAASTCTLSWLVRRLPAFPAAPRPAVEDLGNALDVLVSFCLVAAMVGFGLLGSLPAGELAAWNVAVVLNVLGAGLGRVSSSISHIP